MCKGGWVLNVPVLIQKADDARPACILILGFILLACLCDFARVVIPSYRDDRAEAATLRLQPLLCETLRSKLRNIPFCGIIVRILSELTKLVSV